MTGSGLTLKTGIVGVSGDLTNLNLFDVFTGAIKFAVAVQDVDVDLDGNNTIDLDNAKLLTLSLSLDEDAGVATEDYFLQFGTSSAGVKITDGSLRLALLAPSNTTADSRRWRAIQATGLSATMTIPGVTGTVTNTGIAFNQAVANTGVPVSAIDWTKAIDVNSGDATFTPTPVEIGGATIDLTVAKLAVTVDIVNVDLFDVFTGGIHLALETKKVDVSFDGTTIALNDATLLTLGLSLDEANAADPETFFLKMGDVVTVNDGSLRMAILTPADAADARTWRAIQASGLSASIPFFGALAITNVGLNYNASAPDDQHRPELDDDGRHQRDRRDLHRHAGQRRRRARSR